MTDIVKGISNDDLFDIGNHLLKKIQMKTGEVIFIDSSEMTSEEYLDSIHALIEKLSEN